MVLLDKDHAINWLALLNKIKDNYLFLKDIFLL
jgi:hypothetical protein